MALRHDEGELPVVVVALATDRHDDEYRLTSLADEERKITAALEPLVDAGEIEPVHVLRYATVDELRRVFLKRRLRDRIAIFHFGGHAGPRELVFETQSGHRVPTDASAVAKYLGQQRGLTLVFLNGCSTKAQIDLLWEVGIKAIVATTQQIDDERAATFAGYFYAAIAAGTPISEAFESARAQLRLVSEEEKDDEEERTRDVVGVGSSEALGSSDLFAWVLLCNPEFEHWVPQRIPPYDEWKWSLHDILTDSFDPWEFRDFIERQLPGAELETDSMAPSIAEDLEALVADEYMTPDFFAALRDELGKYRRQLGHIARHAGLEPSPQRPRIYPKGAKVVSPSGEGSTIVPSKSSEAREGRVESRRSFDEIGRGSSATRTHAILIGIDDYVVRPLRGCVHDVDRIQHILLDRLGVDAADIQRLVSPREGYEPDDRIPSCSASRANILAAFESLAGGRIGPDERIFVYYAGHGSMVRARGTVGVVQREALVPADALGVAGGAPRDLLWDVEINWMLRRWVGSTTQVTVMLDCCHSAGVTRGPSGSGRRRNTRQIRFEGTFDAEELGLGRVSNDGEALLRDPGGSLLDCVVVTASQAGETAAEEEADDGTWGGTFTRAFIEQLGSVSDSTLDEVRWGSIWYPLVAAVRERSRQQPELIGGFARRVFGSPPQSGDTGFEIERRGEEYVLAVGELAGVSEGARVAVYGDEPIVLPQDTRSDAEMRARRGVLTVTEAGPSTATAVLPSGTGTAEFPTHLRGRMIHSGRAMRLPVRVEPADARVRDVVRDSGLLRLVEDGGSSLITLRRTPVGDWALTDDHHRIEEPLVRIPGDASDRVMQRVLEHYGRYIAPVRMAERCRSLPEATLLLEVLDCADLRSHQGLDLQDPPLPRIEPEGRVVPLVHAKSAFCFAVRNMFSEPLFVTLFSCQTSGKVVMLTGGRVEVPAGGRHVLWSQGVLGEAFRVGVAADRTFEVDHVVAIGTTERDRKLDHMAHERSFQTILADGRYRHLGGGAADGATFGWTAARLVVRTTLAHAHEVPRP